MRQIAWVFDLNKCIGCQTCSVACKVLWTDEEGMDHMWWMTVNTMPGRGTPRDWEQMGGGYRDGRLQLGHLPTEEEFGGGWDYNWAEMLRGGKGRQAQFTKVKGSPSWGPNWDEDEGGGQWPNAYFFYLPRLCNHCTRPACLEACPHGAIFKREEDGLVLRDEDLCHGEQMCARACPYKKIYFNKVRGISQHCIGCFPRLEQGVAPACVRQCPGRAVWVGFLDDQEGAVYKLVHKWRVALPLHPEFGTQPNVYYVPPLSPAPFKEDGTPDWERSRIPLEYLRRLFGPAVEEALATLRREMDKRRRRPKEDSELMDILIAYRFQELLGPFTADPAEVKT
jgi:DMSO reductase family type II enzyme iron-sulfur subunit